jgi:hypothetical protein
LISGERVVPVLVLEASRVAIGSLVANSGVFFLIVANPKFWLVLRVGDVERPAE